MRAHLPTELKPRELNTDLVSSIRAARQKLSVDKENPHSQLNSHAGSPAKYQIYKGGSTLVEKTIQTLKNKIEVLEAYKQYLSSNFCSLQKIHQTEVDSLKSKLTKYIERDFEQSLAYSSIGHDPQQQISDLKDQLNRKQVYLELYISKYRQIEIANDDMKNKVARLNCYLYQIQKEKDRHIELNVQDKLKWEYEIKKLETDRYRQRTISRRSYQYTMHVRKYLHQLQTQQRMYLNTHESEKKTSEEYEFYLKEMAQKHSVKTTRLEKYIALLRKTVYKLKNTHNQSDVYALSHAEREIEHLKERLLYQYGKISIKQIELDRTNEKTERLIKQLHEKDNYIKKLEQNIQKKYDNEKNLLAKLAKTGLPPKESFSSTGNYSSNFFAKSKKDIDMPSKFFSTTVQNESDTPTFTKDIQKVTHERGYSSDHCGETQSIKSDFVGRIVKYERALADLKSTYKNVDCSDMSLSQIMLEIKKKGDRISEMRQRNTEK